MSLKLFTIDEKTKLPVISAEALTIDCFRNLWRRVKKVDGDSAGRDKKLNEMELSYVFFSVKIDKKFKHKTGKDRDAEIRKLIGIDKLTYLTKPLEWEPDTLVKECIEEYREIQVTASYHLVLSLEAGARAITTYVNGISQYIENHRTAIEGGTSTMDPDDIVKVMKIITEAPTTVESVMKARLVLDKEQDALASGRKGREFNKFEMP